MTDDDKTQCAARDTSVEGRLSDLENAFHNEYEATRQYWQAAEKGGDLQDAANDRLLTRVEALEKYSPRIDSAIIDRLEALEKSHEHAVHAESHLYKRMDEVDRKYGAADDLHALYGRLIERMDRLETSAIAHLVESERQERWHDVYCAALQGAMANGDPTSDEYPSCEDCHVIAIEQADRAHGPLKREFNHASALKAPLTPFGEDVAALVSAARRVLASASLVANECAEVSSEQLASLSQALRAFEPPSAAEEGP